MNSQQSKIKLIAMALLLLVCLSSGSCSPGRDFDARLRSIVKPHRFSIVGWECKAIPAEVSRWISGKPKEIDGEVSVVTEYFSSVKQIRSLQSEIEAANTDDEQGNLASLETELDKLQERKAVLQGTVERIIAKQIKETLAEQSIFNPIDKYIKLKVGFPPVSFRLEKPPYFLVISPRERIESLRRIPLKRDTILGEMEDIEALVDKLGVSSLVVGLGGYSTYPSIVTDDASLRFTIDVVTEEWLHQYLVFKPLGFRYTLDSTGISRDYEIATMNETLVGIVGEEIGSTVRVKYYSEYENSGNQSQRTESGFDFNREMREIRKTVDEYLAQGEIERAEEFMEQKRQYLVSKGYNVRKLNQAYFAFYGTYADSPTSISPIGLELKELRSQSASLKDFLETVAAMTSRQALRESIK